MLSRIERARGGNQGADRLLTRAIQSARHVGYNLAVERAERHDGWSPMTIERQVTS
jgi:hypothetical protein